jgi:hypothetical protein
MKLIKIAQQLRLKDIRSVKTNFSDADFWIQRKGSRETVGTPTKSFSPEHIGIKVENTDILDPQYLFYMFMHLQSSGKFQNLSKGSLSLQHITTYDIGNIILGS